MKAVQLVRHGKPSVLQVTDVPEPVPRGDQVRVKVATIGINFAETLSRRGLYKWAPPLPYVLGMEAFGHIDAVGPDADQRRIGEPVLVGAQYGCYAEKVVVPEGQARPAVERYTPEENAAFVVTYLTAWVALFEMARLRPSDRVLVQAAAGGVGTAAVHLAKAFGCKVYGTAGSDHKLELLRRLNVDHAVNYRKRDFEAELREVTGGEGVDVVLEVVGGEVFRKSVRLLAPLGRIVVVGFASLDLKKWNPLTWWRTHRDVPRADLRSMARGSYGLLASHVGYLLRKPALVSALWHDLTAYVARHDIRPVVGATFPFDEIPRAHALMESRASTGKIVVRVGSDV